MRREQIVENRESWWVEEDIGEVLKKITNGVLEKGFWRVINEGGDCRRRGIRRSKGEHGKPLLTRIRRERKFDSSCYRSINRKRIEPIKYQQRNKRS